MIRTLPAALLLLWTVALANDEAPGLKTPNPFDHADHSAAFAAAGVTCVDCHAVGLRAPKAEAPAPALPAAPWSSCHGCHQGELKKAPKNAPTACLTCHASLADLKPASHDIDWIAQHGDAARGLRADCESCHTAPSFCTSCHAQRGALSENPHPPGFSSFHGVEARLDPRACTTCHTPTTCTGCHQSGAAPW